MYTHIHTYTHTHTHTHTHTYNGNIHKNVRETEGVGLISTNQRTCLTDTKYSLSRSHTKYSRSRSLARSLVRSFARSLVRSRSLNTHTHTHTHTHTLHTTNTEYRGVSTTVVTVGAKTPLSHHITVPFDGPRTTTPHVGEKHTHTNAWGGRATSPAQSEPNFAPGDTPEVTVKRVYTALQKSV